MNDSHANHYLEQEVLTASPARLRWLLIQKGVGLCKVVGQLWQQGERDRAAQWLLRLRDILGELLAGIRSDDPLAKQVADIYIFCLQLLTAAEAERSLARLEQLREILEIEQETWQLVVKQSLVATDSRPTQPRQPMLRQAPVASQAVPAGYQPFSFEA